eukprot:Hpha_TRINITY_DN2183_c0_g1::TRINITY_DN2183_c0_g1_i1::g.42378::m.42378/K00857/tdk, TK; thymidine kinase
MGKLYFYYSAMNAGKSTTLLQSAYNYHERGMSTVTFCPDFEDKRFGSNVSCVKSRLGLKGKAVLFSPTFDFFEFVRNLVTTSESPARGTMFSSETMRIREVEPENVEANPSSESLDAGNLLKHGPLRCVLIDEAHFLNKKQVAQLVLVSKQLDLAVLCYGLRTDFLGEPFEGSKYLLCWAECLTEIKTMCCCGSKATMNVRMEEVEDEVTGEKRLRASTGGEQICIGGNERYISACMVHFNEQVKAVSAAADVAQAVPVP